MTAQEFGLWQARMRLEPVGLYAALPAILAALANGPVQHKDDKQRMWSASDFAPKFSMQEEKPTELKPQDLQAQIEMLNVGIFK